MRKLKCLVIDDEPISRKGIQSFVEKVDFLQFEGSAKDIDELITILNDREIDLLFLDIEMPGISGIEFVKSHSKQLPLVVFITAYHEFAVESYNLAAVDYLLKPTSFERFLDAAHRALEIRTFNQEKADEKDYFFIRHDGQYKKIKKGDVIYISAMQNYVRLHTKGDQTLIVHYSLKAISEFLDGKFVLVHKSYIVNLEFVEAVTSTAITLTGQGQVPIGRHYRKKVMPLLVPS